MLHNNTVVCTKGANRNRPKNFQIWVRFPGGIWKAPTHFFGCVQKAQKKEKSDLKKTCLFLSKIESKCFQVKYLSW